MPMTIEKRFFADIDKAVGISPITRKMLESNPFADKAQDAIQLVGLQDGQVAGGEAVFPLKIKARAEEIKVIGGAELWVDESKRQSMLGIMLPDAICRNSPSKMIVGAAASQLALPVYKVLGYKIFLMPRYIVLWKSRSVVEMKLSGTMGRVVSKIADGCIGIYASILSVATSMAMRGIKVVEINPSDRESINAIAKLIASDKHLFSEVHDAKWIRWHFDVYKETRLYGVYERDALIGMFMTYEKFYEQASHRGFRNVRLGSVLEWQVKDECQHLLKWMVVKASLLLRKSGVDAVDVPTVDGVLQTFFDKIQWRRVGESNFVYKTQKGSPLHGDREMMDVQNWRLRPAMSDVGLG